MMDANPFVQAYQDQQGGGGSQPPPAPQTQQTPQDQPADIPGVTDNPFIMGFWNATGATRAARRRSARASAKWRRRSRARARWARSAASPRAPARPAWARSASPGRRSPIRSILASQAISKGTLGAIPPDVAQSALGLAIPEAGGLGLAEAGEAAAARQAAQAPKPAPEAAGVLPSAPSAPSAPGEPAPASAEQPSAPSARAQPAAAANDNPFVQAHQAQGSPATPDELGPAQAGDLGAAKTPTDVTKEFTGGVADDLHRNQTAQEGDKIEMRDRWEAMPESARNPQTQQDWYRMGEDEHRPADPAFKEHIQPMRDEAEDLYKKETFYRGKLALPEDEEDAVPRTDPYMHKMVKGKSQLDALTGNAPDPDPWAASRRVDSKIPTKANSSYGRQHFALVGEDGERLPVRLSNDKKTLEFTGQQERGAKLSKKLQGPSNRVERLPNAKGNIKPGETVMVNGKPMRLGEAKARETTAAGGPEYYENAFAAAATNLRQKRAVVRSLKAMSDLKNSPQFEANTRQMRPDGSPPPGTPTNWRRPEFPAFAQRYMHPDIANVIDDFYKRRGADSEWLDKINNIALQTLFFGNPFIHGMNVAAHWYTARGFDWLRPTRYYSLAKTMTQAIQEVKTLGPKYREYVNNGSALLAAGTRMRDFDQQMLSALGETIVKDPKRWNPVIRKLGLNSVADAVKAMSQHSQAALWNIGDVFMMQRVMELEQRGMPLRQAIRETEKHIPNYRLPQKIGTRGIQQFLSNRVIASFSRYHFGMINSFVHMAVDLAGPGKTMAERMEAAGQILATASLVYFITPALNYALQKLTGNAKAKVPSRGSGTIPGMLKDYYNGDTSIPQMFGRLLTLAPLPKWGFETATNRDSFTGRTIGGAPDLKGVAAHVGHTLRTFSGGGQDLARQGIEAAQQGGIPGGLKGLGEGLLKRSLGVSVPSPEQAKKAEDYKKRAASEEKSFEKGSYLHYLFGTSDK